MSHHRRLAVLTVALAALVLVPAAAADEWLPHPEDATWTYEWTDSVYNTTPTTEKVTVKERSADSFTLAWTTVGQGNAAAAPSSIGSVSFKETAQGLTNASWSSNEPPANFPVLCSAAAGCPNSLASVYYNVIWGARTPSVLLPAPLLKGTSWSATGGGGRDTVSSASDYVGREKVTVPAFPGAVLAAKIRSEVTQAGTLGDPYGSGVRTTWWVYGVGPVKVQFQHAGNGGSVTTAVLKSTNQEAKSPPSDAVYFPLVKGQKARLRWSNSKHMKKPSVQELLVDASVNGSARVTVKHLSGPIRVAGSYVFTTRADGVTNLSAATSSATLAPLPPLGPAAVPKSRRRAFATPYDLMVFGFNPVVPANPAPGASWSSSPEGGDFALFGVTGSARVVAVARSVKVPAGTFKALVIESKLTQKGFPFGSGTRTAWFAPDRGLVKLVFRHGDGSTSTVERLR